MLKIYENELPMPVRNDGIIKVCYYTDKDWAIKVKEELAEALTAGSPEEQAKEITDIITTCTSWLEACGYDLNERRRLCKEVNLKNNTRNYFDMEVKKDDKKKKDAQDDGPKAQSAGEENS